MTPDDETAPLFEKIDDLADDHLVDIQRRLEHARDRIESAGERLTEHLTLDPADDAAAAEAPPARAGKPLSAVAAAAKSELEAYLAQSARPAGEKSETQRTIAQPVVRDAADFGDIAATIATDDEWKTP